MLSVKTQNQTSKLDIANYSLKFEIKKVNKQDVRVWQIITTKNNKEIVLGTYSTKDRAKFVFDQMVDYEERQNTEDYVYVIYQMPEDSEELKY